MSYRNGRRFAAAVAVLVGIAGCGADDSAPEQGSADAAAEAPAPAAAPPMTDAGIAAIVVAANTIDVRYGEIALERGTDERVKQFAQMMITDHNAVNESAGELVGRLGITPEENDVSRSLEASAADTRARLESLSGAEFDRAYIANEVAYHRAVLDALDMQLVPGATNEELRATLVSVRPAFEAHLRHAEGLQRDLGA